MAKSSVCCVEFDIGKMRTVSPDSHGKSDKHKRPMQRMLSMENYVPTVPKSCRYNGANKILILPSTVVIRIHLDKKQPNLV